MEGISIKNELTIFNYGLNKVRTVIKDGEPWFVLKDVCDVLEINNSRNVQERLDEEEKNTVCIMDGNRGNPNTTIINESGLYSVILLSRKPEARKFKKWITHEVLPSIRKTGAYIQTPQTYIQALEALIESERAKEKLLLENDDLKIELDENKKYYTIKRVASINKISWRRISWRNLINTSHAMEKEIKKVFDPNLTKVNAYHIDVWKYEYPELMYEE